MVRIVLALLASFLVFATSAAQSDAGQPVAQRASPGALLQLSLKQAVDLALAPDGNARVQLAAEFVEQSRSRLAQSRAALLPNLDSSAVQQNQTRNLAAFGIKVALPIPGFQFPEVVGPFDVFDARLTLTQSLVDLSSIRRYQTSRKGVDVAETEQESARDLIAGQVARLYLAALRAETRVEAEQANATLAEALLKLAGGQKDAGTGTAIEVTRARVQWLNARQRLLVAETERHQARLQLARAIGLELEIPFQLSDRLSYLPVQVAAADQAIAAALESRLDLKAQQRREEAARLAYSAARLERFPSLVAFGDYGTIGSSIGNASPTRTFGLSLRLPLFDGGRRDARRAESLSLVEQERIRTQDLKHQIRLEVLLALDSLRSADEQVQVAEEGMDLSEQELAQARRRYQAGMTSSIEVTDAQTRLERARDNRIAALFNHNLARISLGEAMGTIRSLVR
ncbi:MAG: TolC family protein [Acidobacteria bacterium]|nr:TolC family protein [Acidobacteriota bacterium]